MVRKLLVFTVLSAVIGLLVFGAVNRTLAKTQEDIPGDSVGSRFVNQGYGQRNGSGDNLVTESGIFSLPPAVPGELEVDETTALLYMREEEKLARDVYLALSAQWGLPIFQNIGQSEQVHMEAVKALIDRYQIDDPASDTVGLFTDPDLQSLYNALVFRGAQSLADGLQVGTEIEEIDIRDLEKYLSEVDNTDIQRVFTNLMSGSYNHLSAFTATLFQQTGLTYPPRYLSPDVFQAIVGDEDNRSAGGGAVHGNHGNRP